MTPVFLPTSIILWVADGFVVPQIIDKQSIQNRLKKRHAKKVLPNTQFSKTFHTFIGFTRKPLASPKQISLAKCYQIVIKPFCKMPQTRINTGFFVFLLLLELFFWFDFSCKFVVIAFQNRIILIRFCILLIWFQSCCTQIVPSYSI